MELEINPSVSVIIPFYHNVAELERCLEAVNHSNSREKFEVIVVDDHGPEEPAQVAHLVTKYGDRYHRQPKNLGPGVARNCGAKLARGETLVFLDSDCVPSVDWIKMLIEPIIAGSARATTSCYTSPVKSSWITDFQNEDYLYRMPSEECDTYFVNSCNLAVEQEVFLQCGGFPSQRVSEDMVLGMRLLEQGTPARYLPHAGVKHAYHRNLAGYLKQRFNFALNTVRSIFDKDRWRPTNNVSGVRSFNPIRTFLGIFFALFMIVAIISAVAAFATDRRYDLILVAAGIASLIWGVLVHGKFIFFLGKRKGTLKALSYIPLLLAIDLAYAAGVFSGATAGLMDRLNPSKPPTLEPGLANASELPIEDDS